MSKQDQRKLTISSKHQGYPNTPLPELQLSGKWLAELGFTSGDKVSLTIQEGLILIQSLEL